MSAEKKVYTFAVAVACAGIALAAVAFQVGPAVSGPHSFYTVTPCRVFDTREMGLQTTGQPLPNPGPHNFRIQGNCGVPNGAAAVAVQVTVVAPTQAGDLRLFPTGSTPLTSTLNYRAGQAALANNATVSLASVLDATSKDLSIQVGMATAGDRTRPSWTCRATTREAVVRVAPAGWVVQEGPVAPADLAAVAGPAGRVAPADPAAVVGPGGSGGTGGSRWDRRIRWRRRRRWQRRIRWIRAARAVGWTPLGTDAHPPRGSAVDRHPWPVRECRRRRIEPAPGGQFASRASKGRSRGVAPGLPRRGGCGSRRDAGATFGADSRLEMQLLRAETVRALEVQAEGTAILVVEASRDGHGWELLWRVPSQSLPGLRTRLALFTEGRELRFLRLRCEETAAPCVVARIHAYRSPPAVPLAPALAGPRARASPTSAHPAKDGRHQGVGGRRGRPGPDAGFALPSVRRGARHHGPAAGPGALLRLLLFNLFRFHFDRYLHVWEIYHYYVGAKYFPELGYTRLYTCTALADEESGAGPAASRSSPSRPAHEPADPSHRPRTPKSAGGASAPRAGGSLARTWHGFVASSRCRAGKRPCRTMATTAPRCSRLVGGALASTGPASDRQILLLALVDPLLLAVLWGLVLWAFGWRTLCVALVFWGTNYPAHYYWNGGAFLRQDWLLLSVAALCLMRRGRMVAAGVAVTDRRVAARVPSTPARRGRAPGPRALRARTKASWSRRRTGACCSGVWGRRVILVPLSSWRAGVEAWPAFFENSRKHVATPLTNNVGLATLLGYSNAGRARLLVDDRLTDPYEPWKLARQETQATRRPLFWLLLAAYLLLLARALRQAEDWQAAVLGIGLIPVVGEVTCYYYSILLGLAFLRESVPWSGPALLFYSLSTWVCAAATGWFDEQFTCISACTLLLVGLVTWWAGSRARPVTDEAGAPRTGLTQRRGEA